MHKLLGPTNQSKLFAILTHREPTDTLHAACGLRNSTVAYDLPGTINLSETIRNSDNIDIFNRKIKTLGPTSDHCTHYIFYITYRVY